MRIAILADAHGNNRAVEAALSAIESEGVDLIVAAGDMVNPFPGSHAVWEMVRSDQIVCLKGNQEEFLIFHARASGSDPLRSSPQYRPIQFAARSFSESDISLMDDLPFSVPVDGEGEGGLLVCHASPFDPWRSISDQPDDSLKAQFRRVRQSTIVAGHRHRPWRGAWQEKTLALCGSCGFPITGDPRLCYMIAESSRAGWILRDVYIDYDRNGFISDVIESGFLGECGPIGWLIFADFVFLESHLMEYFRHEHRTFHPKTHREFVAAAKRHFERTDRLSEMVAYIGADLS